MYHTIIPYYGIIHAYRNMVVFVPYHYNITHTDTTYYTRFYSMPEKKLSVEFCSITHIKALFYVSISNLESPAQVVKTYTKSNCMRTCTSKMFPLLKSVVYMFVR